MSQGTTLFISAYKTAEVKKSWKYGSEKVSLQELLKKYHLEYIATSQNLVSESDEWDVSTIYDDVQQCTSFQLKARAKQEKSQESKSKQFGFYMNLKHAFSLLADSAYFNLKYTFWLKPLEVWIGEDQYQVDAGAFVMNEVLIVVFELISQKSGKPLTKDDVGAKVKNYNLLPVCKYRFCDGKIEAAEQPISIPHLIQKIVSDFFWELMEKKYKLESYGYIHDIAVCANGIDNVHDYICKLIGVKKPVSSIVDISTVDIYEYYPQDGVSVTTDYDEENINMVVYSVMVLEVIKLYIYLFQIENLGYEEKLSRLVQNHLYLQNLFCSPNVPIETRNLLEYIRGSESYRTHEEGIRIKIAYMKEKNEQKKNKSAAILNVLLYFASFLGAVATLETLETHLGLPFGVGFGIVVSIFIFGLIWLGKEHIDDKNV